MSKAVNIFALFAIISMVTCVTFAPKPIPEQKSYQTNESFAQRIGCGAVNFVVTSYLPRPHTNAFCSAYLQVPSQAFAPTAAPLSSMWKDGHSLVSASTHQAFRHAVVPEFSWLRNREVRNPPLSTLLGKACSCLTPQEPETEVISTTDVEVSAPRKPVLSMSVAATAHTTNGSNKHSQKAELMHLQPTKGLYGRERLGLFGALSDRSQELL